MFRSNTLKLNTSWRAFKSWDGGRRAARVSQVQKKKKPKNNDVFVAQFEYNISIYIETER